MKWNKKEIDILLAHSLILFSESDGEECKKCNIIQGRHYKGWEKYYCKHLNQKIKDKINNQRKKANHNLIGLILSKKE